MIKKFLKWLDAMQARNKTYNELAKLDDRALKDIGIFRCDIPRIAAERYDEIMSASNHQCFGSRCRC